jgi:pimeloyl-ACP methyl ester carboxylesterase
MDCESQESRDLGCWDAPTDLTDMIDSLTTTDTVSDFVMPQKYADFLIDIGFGRKVADKDRDFWRKEIAHHYSGDDGRRRARMATINLRDRDGLHGRLFDVRCPVLWLHGTADPVYSVKNAQREVKKFVNSPDVQLKVVEGGEHFLSFSHPNDVDAALVEFVGKYGKA